MLSKMKTSLCVVIGVWILGVCSTDTTTPAPVGPFVGTWNITGSDDKVCMKLKAGIQLDITYDANHNGTHTSTIPSTHDVVVNESESHCVNATDLNQTLALKFGDERTLYFYFTRDPQITKDDKKDRWQLFKVEFRFVYDNETFPDSKAQGKNETLSNTNTTLSSIATSSDRSFTCSKTGTIDVNNRFKISYTNLRAQAFMTRDDFSAADPCAADQETTDLIPIIIGAALAALVIIVLIAYLIGRARANTPAYDNMK